MNESISRTVKQARGAARLDALTQAAAEMFLEMGYDALSLDAVIERVGGSRRNVYAHFGGKEGLFIEAIKRRCQELGEPLRTLSIDDAGMTVDDALITFGRAILAIVLSSETLALHRLMVAEGRRFPDLARAMWEAGHDASCRALTPWIERQQRAGRLRADGDPNFLATQFVDMVTADAQLRALIGTAKIGEKEMRLIVDEAVSTFLRGRVA